jgi:hypothetical protein
MSRLGAGHGNRVRAIYDALADAETIPDPFTEDTHSEASETLKAKLDGQGSHR